MFRVALVGGGGCAYLPHHPLLLVVCIHIILWSGLFLSLCRVPRLDYIKRLTSALVYVRRQGILERRRDDSEGKVALRTATAIYLTGMGLMRSRQAVASGVDWERLWRTKSLETSDERGLIGDG